MLTDFGRRSFVTWTIGLKERIQKAERENQMREIKLRAWDKERNEMHYGKENDCTIATNLFGQTYYCDFLNYNTGDSDHLDYVDNDRFILMQFTGLKDKNGKEGYKDDKVSFGSTRPVYLIKWSVCNAGFYLESMDERKERLGISNFTVGEIIGNIHQEQDNDPKNPR